MKIEKQEERDHLVKLAETLIIIPECPRHVAAIQALALYLEENCSDWEEAVWLVKEAQGWREWQGPYGLNQLLFDRRNPPATSEPKPQVEAHPWEPLDWPEAVRRGLIAPPCERCWDSGYVGDPPTVEFCDCRIGRHQRWFDGQQGLDQKNFPREERKAAEVRNFKRITQEDIDRIKNKKHLQ